MAAEDSAERTEEPSAKRQQDAREEGRRVTSAEVFVVASLVAGTGVLAAMMADIRPVAAHWAGYLAIAPGEDLDARIAANIGTAVRDVVVASLIVAVPVMLAVLGAQAAMGGLGFASKAIGLKFDKLDPLKGIGRMFSMQALVNLGKAILKVGILVAIAWVVVKDDLARLDVLWSQTAATSIQVLVTATLRLLFALCLGLAVIGAADLFWQAFSLTNSLRMTKQEVKEENKESNGSPEVKGRQRQLQMEASRRAARQRGALDDVGSATAVITNPIHFAVALRYVPGETAAPVIVAMGRGVLAHEVMARARKKGIPVLQIPLLARALYYTGDIGAEIGERLFAAVAAVLAHVWRLEQGETPDLPEVEIPPDLRFSANGRPLDPEEDDDPFR